MRFLLLALIVSFSSLTARAETVYFLGLDRGVYLDSGSGIQRVGLGTGRSLAVYGGQLFLAGDDGRIWTADQKGRWQPKTGTAGVQKVAVDSSGSVFLLGNDGGVYRWSEGTASRRGLAVVSDVAVASNGELYAVGTDQKIWRSPAGGQSWAVYNPLALAKKIAATPDGTVYVIGTDDGVYKVTAKTITRLGLATGREISVGPRGQVGIVGTDNAVYLLDGASSWRRLGSGTASAIVWPR